MTSCRSWRSAHAWCKFVRSFESWNILIFNFRPKIKIPTNSDDLPAEERERNFSQIVDYWDHQLFSFNIIQFHEQLPAYELFRVHNFDNSRLFARRDRFVLSKRYQPKNRCDLSVVCIDSLLVCLGNSSTEHFDLFDRELLFLRRFITRLLMIIFLAWHVANVCDFEDPSTRWDYQSKRLKFYKLNHLVYLSLH